MRKLIVAEHISLDGVVQGPGGPEEDTSGHFSLGGWSAPYGDDSVDRTILDLHAQPFELLLGRKTYDIWATYWPKVDPGNVIADAFNGTVKHVVTHRADSLTWDESRAVGPDLAAAVRDLKQQGDTDLLTWGSSDVVRQLLEAGLVDTFWLFVYPVILGRGKRIFAEGSLAAKFDVGHAETSSKGVQVLRLERAGMVETGSVT